MNESPKENVECARNSEVIILPNMTFWGSLGQQGVAMDVGGNPGNNNVADVREESQENLECQEKSR